MSKVAKPGYYAVLVGRLPGIYRSWPECEAQVRSFPGAVFKKLDDEDKARDFMATKPGAVRTVSVLGNTASAVPAIRPTFSPARVERDCDTVYCDGACKGNGQPGSVAGIGVWWGHGDARNLSERCPGDQTNNRAELIAIIRVLETTLPLKRRLVIKTDSYYAVHCVMVWISKWTNNGFLTANGKPVKNRAVIKYLAALLHVRRETSQTVELKHVRGHVGIEGNEAADRLASLGTTMPSVPERDWEELEDHVWWCLEPAEPIAAEDDDLEAYAAGLLNDNQLAELDDLSGFSATPPHSGNEESTAVSPVRALPGSQMLDSTCQASPATTSKPSENSLSKEELEASGHAHHHDQSVED